MDCEPKTKIKIIMIGEVCVGKSCLIKQFIDKDVDMTNVHATIAVAFNHCNIVVDGKPIKLEILDTAGQERFRSLIPSYYRNTHGAILVYDVNRLESFNKIENWIDDLDRYNNNDHLIRMLIGNKIDVPTENRQVSRETGVNFARKHKMLFCETSAKWHSSIKYAFDEMAEKITTSDDFIWAETNDNIIDLNEPQKSFWERWFFC